MNRVVWYKITAQKTQISNKWEFFISTAQYVFFAMMPSLYAVNLGGRKTAKQQNANRTLIDI